MPKYQVAVIDRPEKWTPECADDVPLELHGPVEVLAESDDLFAAVDRAMEHNESGEAAAAAAGPWWSSRAAPAASGPTRGSAPRSPTKSPPSGGPTAGSPIRPWTCPTASGRPAGRAGGEWLSYPQAEATVLALNRQCMDHPGAAWHVVVATENEPASRTVSYDPAGAETTVEVRRMHVIRPEHGGHGDCSHCPAGTFPCAKADWSSQPQDGVGPPQPGVRRGLTN